MQLFACFIRRLTFGCMQGFFTTFPALRSNPFWVTGESYGGHYVPTAVQYILEQNANPENNLPKINLVGLQARGVLALLGQGWLIYDSGLALRRRWRRLATLGRMHSLTTQALWTCGMATTTLMVCAETCVCDVFPRFYSSLLIFPGRTNPRRSHCNV